MSRPFGSGTFGSGNFSASTIYTASAAQGAVTLTGETAGTRAAFALSAASGTLSIAGQIAGLSYGYILAAVQGVISLTGGAAAFVSGKIWADTAPTDEDWFAQPIPSETWTEQTPGNPPWVV